jgi:hypothetical protein
MPSTRRSRRALSAPERTLQITVQLKNGSNTKIKNSVFANKVALGFKTIAELETKLSDLWTSGQPPFTVDEKEKYSWLLDGDRLFVLNGKVPTVLTMDFFKRETTASSSPTATLPSPIVYKIVLLVEKKIKEKQEIKFVLVSDVFKIKKRSEYALTSDKLPLLDREFILHDTQLLEDFRERLIISRNNSDQYNDCTLFLFVNNSYWKKVSHISELRNLKRVLNFIAFGAPKDDCEKVAGGLQSPAKKQNAEVRKVNQKVDVKKQIKTEMIELYKNAESSLHHAFTKEFLAVYMRNCDIEPLKDLKTRLLLVKKVDYFPDDDWFENCNFRVEKGLYPPLAEREQYPPPQNALRKRKRSESEEPSLKDIMMMHVLERKKENERAMAGPIAQATPPPPTQASGSGGSAVDLFKAELLDLKEMYDTGLINADDFQNGKSYLLQNLAK